MDNRRYNIFFHLHTVSGIVISVLVYIIFFAGSFSFFRDDIVNWERNDAPNTSDAIHTDYDLAIHRLDSAYALYGREVEIRRFFAEENLGVSLEPSKDTVANPKGKSGAFFYYHSKTGKTQTYEASYTLGEFLYRLHFFAQVPTGYYLSGFTALFLVFALLTGLLVHWRKIISNFFVFRPKEKLKTLWTDAHTALGMIGLPFQLVYAVTGAFFMIKVLLIAPNVVAFFSNDEGKFYEALGYREQPTPFAGRAAGHMVSFSALAQKASARWPGFEVTELHIENFGDANMRIRFEGHVSRKDKFTGNGSLTFDASGHEVSVCDPFRPISYADTVKDVLYRLHYGDYGGYALRFVSFLMGLSGCFVVLSGVMVWLTARNKKKIPERKRRFNERVSRIYLAICLPMLPVTALAFVVVKLFPSEGAAFLYSLYFLTWLSAALFFIWKGDNRFTNRASLAATAILGVAIPLLDGFTTGSWLWAPGGHVQSFVVDMLWLLLAVGAGYGVWRSIQSQSQSQ